MVQHISYLLDVDLSDTLGDGCLLCSFADVPGGIVNSSEHFVLRCSKYFQIGVRSLTPDGSSTFVYWEYATIIHDDFI